MERSRWERDFRQFYICIYAIIIIACKNEGEGIHGWIEMKGDWGSQTNLCALFLIPQRRGKQTNLSLFTFEPAVPVVLGFYELVIWPCLLFNAISRSKTCIYYHEVSFNDTPWQITSNFLLHYGVQCFYHAKCLLNYSLLHTKFMYRKPLIAR